MCGITGYAGEIVPGPEALARMCSAIRHRGPDSLGSHIEDGVGLGFRRLAIIDLESGDQPIGNEDGSVIATCNGEIYNFRQLRSELIARGHTFRTGSDAEVIPHLYEEKGERFVDSLRGMFAIALWDRSRRRLLLARDRLGVKPLYWTAIDGSIVYGSEPAAVLASGLVEARPDQRSIIDCLTAQYVHPPRSGFAGISKLAPASLLAFEDGRVAISRYWSLRHRPNGFKGEPEAALEEADALLREATRLRMISDVPLGAFLSGGVDSSLIVAYMSKLQSRVRTFSIDFAESRYSEGAHAKRVASLYGTEHETFTVEPDVVPLVADAIKHLGEPFGDSSAIPTYLLSELTRRSVTVSLSGDGGDEAFGGYQRYVVAATADRFGTGARLAGRLGRAIMPAALATRYPRIERGLDALGLDSNDRYAYMMAHFDPPSLTGLCTPEFLEDAGGASVAWDELLVAPPLKGMQRYMALDIETYLPGDLLVKVDRMSMTHALEVRSPLLDHHVHEFAATLPTNLKLRGGTSKWVLRQLAIRHGLPRDLVLRPKQGFGVPIGEWFRKELRGWLTDVLLDPRAQARGYFREGAVERLVSDHIKGRRLHTARLWNLLMLELWHRTWIDA